MTSNLSNIAIDLPKLLIRQVFQPLRLALRESTALPDTQQELAELVNHSLKHQIRAGFTHRFIDILFVTVGNRVFCRRYTYGEPSWHSAFLIDPAGQVKLDKTIVTIKAQQPEDMDTIVPAVNQAYADKLKKLGARFMLAGAVEPRAQESTMELILD